MIRLDRKTIFRIENDINFPVLDTFAKIVIALELTDEEIGTEIRKLALREKHNKKSIDEN